MFKMYCICEGRESVRISNLFSSDSFVKQVEHFLGKLRALNSGKSRDFRQEGINCQ
jgi:hypothetical protein